MRSSVKKTMRVATTFTGVAAGVAAFAPAAKANSAVPYPYKLWVNTSIAVFLIQACGYKDVGDGSWYCTAAEKNPHWNVSDAANYMGSNWKDGKVNIWVWSGSPSGPGEGVSGKEYGHTCNTNGAYHGIFRTGGVSLSTGSRALLGLSTAEC
jgi:hypothetical protein